ncbi:MAG TPA: hypothetical protein VEB41_11160 [Burkholderiales bacterium]|nr:hypothetical protein [Burkholderiales bacterium]
MKGTIHAVALALLLLASAAAHAEPGYVIVDPSDRFATTYVSLARDMPGAELDDLRAKIAPRAGAYLVDWPAFLADPAKHIDAHIARNEYPEVRTAEGLVALLRKFERTPFGLTWNGGIALTGNDYRFAQRTHARHLADASFVARPPDRRADPVHPANHVEPLLGR